jgi:hypothetical protein
MSRSVSSASSATTTGYVRPPRRAVTRSPSWAYCSAKCIQYRDPHDTAQASPQGSDKIRCMPLDLTHLELETAARACRALAYQEDQAAKRMENPGMRGPIENTAQRFGALAEKLEAARKTCGG